MQTSKHFAPKSSKVIDTLRPSRIHATGFCLLALIMFLALFNLTYGLYFAPVVMGYVYVHYRQHFGLHGVTHLSRLPDGSWALNGKAGYELLLSSSVRRYWAVLYFKPQRTVVVFADSLDKEAFRRLRVDLRSLLYISKR